MLGTQNLWGFIDKTGKEVVEPKLYTENDMKYALLDPREAIGENVCLIVLEVSDSLPGLVDKTPFPVFLHPGKALGERQGIIILEGDGFFAGLVDEAPFATVWNFSEGFARVAKNDKIGYIDRTGKEITPLQYSAAGDFSNGMAAVEKGGKWGFIDKTGKEIIPCAYDDGYSFFQGLAAVEKGGKWGFIDTQPEQSPRRSSRPSHIRRE